MPRKGDRRIPKELQKPKGGPRTSNGFNTRRACPNCGREMTAPTLARHIPGFICSSPPTTKGLCVDHDHMTGKVRGLLCWNCNWAIGNAKESEEILLGMINYLRRHKNGSV